MDRSSRRRFLGTVGAAGMAGAWPTLDLRLAAGPDMRKAFTGPYLNAAEFGAVADGSHDATGAIQKALDTQSRLGGGVVALQAGEFTLGGNLHIPESVALCGTARGPTSRAATGFPSDQLAGTVARGTVLRAIGGHGKEDGPPLITLATNAAIQGLAIWYPGQNPLETPVAYPWTLRLNGENVTVENVELLNSWKGINADSAHRHFIRNVTGQPLRIGIFVDNIYDIGRIENVHFNPWWSQSRPVQSFMYRHGESFVFGRSDWEYVLNTFSFGYKTGYRFIQGKTGACNGNFLGIGADASMHAVRVEQSQSPGLLITNGEFVSFDHLALGGMQPRQVVVEAANNGPVRFVNSSFWGPSDGIAKLAGRGTVGFNACTIVQWNPAFAAVESAGAPLIINGCEFQQPGTQVRLGKSVRQAVVSGNLFAGTLRIDNQSSGAVEIGLNSSQ